MQFQFLRKFLCIKKFIRTILWYDLFMIRHLKIRKNISKKKLKLVRISLGARNSKEESLKTWIWNPQKAFSFVFSLDDQLGEQNVVQMESR